MNSNGSFLSTTVARVRAYLDDQNVDAKYSDDFLLRHYIMPAYVDALARLNLGRDEAPVLSYSITATSGVTEYLLPPCVQEVLRLVTVDSSGNVVSDILPLGFRNPRGSQWRVEGNLLVLDSPGFTSGVSLRLDYLTNGDFFPHYATAAGGLTESVAGGGYDVLQLSASPSLGQVDRRENAYAGAMLRLIPTTGKWQERQVEASYYSGGVWYARVRKAFDTGTNPYTGAYELAPWQSQPLYESIATGAAMKLGVARKITQVQMEFLKEQHRIAMKTIKDNLANYMTRKGRHFDKATPDSDLIQGLRV